LVSFKGVVNYTCTSEDTACSTIDDILKEISVPVGTFDLGGNCSFMGINSINNNGLNVTFNGSGGSTNLLYPSCCNQGWFNLSGNYAYQITIIDLEILYPNNGFVGSLFLTSYTPNKINITDCIVYVEPPEAFELAGLVRPIFSVKGGSITIINTQFRNLNFNGVGIIDETGSSINTKFVIVGCTFELIKTVGTRPLLVRVSHRMALNATNNTFSNLEISGSSPIINVLVIDNINISNNTFANVSNVGSCIIINISASYSVSELNFTNVTSVASGGALRLTTSYLPFVLSINTSSFTNCTVLAGCYGGLLLLLLFIWI
jgi:hypothetical protein